MKTKALILYPKYGMVNRLRSLASAKVLADYTGRKLFVNWDPSKECNIEWEELFINKLERYPTPLSGFKAGGNLYDDSNDADGFYWNMPRSLIDNESNVVAVHTCGSFQPAKMSRETYATAKSLFYKSLQPVDAVQETINGILRNSFKSYCVTGIHIRRTDHLCFIKKNPVTACPTDLFIRKMRAILKTSPGTRFFLATDDKREERRVKQAFRDSVIVYEKGVINRDTKEGIRDALIDWLLLSKTSRIIGSYSSSFSEEAAAVNMVKIEPVFSRLLYKTILKRCLETHLSILKRDGLRKYLLYSYNYRKGQISYWISKRIRGCR